MTRIPLSDEAPELDSDDALLPALRYMPQDGPFTEYGEVEELDFRDPNEYQVPSTSPRYSDAYYGAHAQGDSAPASYSQEDIDAWNAAREAASIISEENDNAEI